MLPGRRGMGPRKATRRPRGTPLQGGYPPGQGEGGQTGYSAGNQRGVCRRAPQGYAGGPGNGQQGYTGGQGQQQYAAAGYSGQPPYGGPNGAENGYPQGQPGAGRPPGAPAGQMGGMPQSGQEGARGAPGAANGGETTTQAEAGGEKLNPDDYAPAADAGPAPGPFKAWASPAATSAGVPLYHDAAALPGVNIPQLRLDLHVFAAKPQDRFVMINMHKLHEGDSTPEGVHVDGITPEGAVLSKDGVKFLTPGLSSRVKNRSAWSLSGLGAPSRGRPPASRFPRSFPAHSGDYVREMIAERCRRGSAAAGEPKSDRLLGTLHKFRALRAHKMTSFTEYVVR